MNWVLIAVLAILAICGYAGWRKGIIKMVVSVAAMIVTIIVTVFAAPLLGKIVKNSTKIYDNLYNSVETMVAEALQKTEIGTESYIAGDENEIQTYLGQAAKMLKLPESIAVRVEEDVDYDYIEEIQEQGNTTVNTLVSSIISQRLAQIIFNAIIHIIVFIALFVVIRIVMSVTGIIGRLPVIHEANKLLGLAVGLIEGLLIVWVFFALLTAMGSTEWAVNALADIKSSKLLSLIYDNNLILKSVFRTL
ncbi:MAG: CvpA family protein [Lachnospira sp.]|nr:CvpA family protein [Lachnospira sp.]